MLEQTGHVSCLIQGLTYLGKTGRFNSKYQYFFFSPTSAKIKQIYISTGALHFEKIKILGVGVNPPKIRCRHVAWRAWEANALSPQRGVASKGVPRHGPPVSFFQGRPTLVLVVSHWWLINKNYWIMGGLGWLGIFSRLPVGG